MPCRTKEVAVMSPVVAVEAPFNLGVKRRRGPLCFGFSWSCPYITPTCNIFNLHNHTTGASNQVNPNRRLNTEKDCRCVSKFGTLKPSESVYFREQTLYLWFLSWALDLHVQVTLCINTATSSTCLELKP